MIHRFKIIVLLESSSVLHYTLLLPDKGLNFLDLRYWQLRGGLFEEICLFRCHSSTSTWTRSMFCQASDWINTVDISSLAFWPLRSLAVYCMRIGFSFADGALISIVNTVARWDASVLLIFHINLEELDRLLVKVSAVPHVDSYSSWPSAILCCTHVKVQPPEQSMVAEMMMMMIFS